MNKKEKRKMVNESVGGHIQTARERAGYTQEVLAELLEVTPNHISAIERGVTGATPEMLREFCAKLDVSADYLLFGKDDAVSRLANRFPDLTEMEPKYLPQLYMLLNAALELLKLKDRDAGAPDQ